MTAQEHLHFQMVVTLTCLRTDKVFVELNDKRLRPRDLLSSDGSTTVYDIAHDADVDPQH